MKRKLKRVLCVILTLCMMMTMVPNTVVTAEAVSGDYSFYGDFPTNNNALLPNGSILTVPMLLQQDNGERYEMCENYTVQVDASSYTADEAALVTVEVVNGTDIKFTSNNTGAYGECRITVEAIVNGTAVANCEMVVNTMQTVYDVPVNLTIGNVEVGESIDLTQCFTMKKYTCDNTNGEEIKIFTDSAYVVEVSGYENAWELNGYILTRKEAYNANFSVNVKAANPDDGGHYLWYAGNNYEFESINYSVSWMERYLSIGNVQNSKDFYLDINNIAGKDYDIDFTIGQGPSSDFTVLDNQSQLFTEITDTNTAKVIGIRLNRKAIVENCQGNFEIKTEVKINNQTLYTFVHSVQLISVHFDWDYNNGPIHVYDDATATQFMLDTRSLSDLTNYDINFEIGTVGEQQFVPFDASVQSKLATKVIDQNTGKVTGVILNGVEIGKVCNGNSFTIVPSLTVNGEVIAKSSLGMQLRRTGAEYNYYYGDTNLLPGGGMGIDPQVEYRLVNSQNPNGTWGYVDVTDVSVRSLNDASDVVVVEFDGWMWQINARSLGEAEVTVTHKTPDGGTTTYTFTIGVVDNIWREDFKYKESVQYAVPGGSIGATLDVLHFMYDEQQGQYLANTPFEVEWSPIYQQHAQYLNFTYNNAEKTDVTVNVAANAPLENIPFRFDVYELDANGNRVADEHGNVFPVMSAGYPVQIRDNFNKIKVVGLDETLEVGESMTVTPSLIHVYLDNGVVKEDVLTADTIEWWNDGDHFDIVDQGNGTYVITRLSDWQIETFGIGMEADLGSVKEGASRDFSFPGLEYSVWFKEFRGSGESTWMYDTEDYTLEIDTTNLDDKRADITIDWMVVKWLDPDQNDYEEITSGYTTNGTTITLKGKELAAQGLEAFSVAGIVKSNGYMVGYVAYTDVEFVIDLQPKVENTNTVIDNTVLQNIEADIYTMQNIETALQDDFVGEVQEEVIVNVETESMLEESTVEEIAVAFADIVSDTETESYEIVQYLDISCFAMAMEKDDPTQGFLLGRIVKLHEEKEIEVTIPIELQKPNREFFVLRHHEGLNGSVEVEKLDLIPVSEEKFVFYTNKFSTYALAYVDGAEHIHTETIINAVEADCGNDGYTGDKVCSTCNAVLEMGSVIKADGNHHWSEWKNQEGIAYTFRECWGCGGSEYLNAPDAAPKLEGTAISTPSPATGDASNITLWMMLAVAMAGLAMMIKKNRVQ